MFPAGLSPTLGEFRVEAILGEGGSGIVYDARWGPRRVALKVLHAKLADNARVRAQFSSEARRLQNISHPSVVKVLDVGELPDGRPYLAMERLEGESLATVLGRGALPLAQALELFDELCAAVGALHEQGLAHRDLKPENVFVVDGKHAVLLDLGIAKELDGPDSMTTIDGAVRGTPAYMAPERFFGQPAGIATDLYELALVLYVMLAGRLPWEDLADPAARLSPRPLVELAPVPEELDVEIRRALSTRAQNRPASAHELCEAVRAAMRGDEGLAPAETARMRPAGGSAELAAGRVTREQTTDRGTTPLAWSPAGRESHSAPVPVARSRGRRVAVAIGVLGVLGAGVAWRLSARSGAEDAPAVVAKPAVSDALDASTAPGSPPVANDPWAPAPPPPRFELPARGPELSFAEAQVEAARALRHLPSDTSFVIAALVGPLRRDARFAPLFDRIANDARVSVLANLLPPCVRELIANAEWFVFGSVGFGAEEQGTLIVRGRWERGDVESCFAATSTPREMTDGARVLELPELGWIDFLDASTVYVSVRQDLTAAQVHASVKRPAGLTPRTRALLAQLPEERSLTFVVDGTGGVAWPNETLPAGSDAHAWLRAEPEVVRFEVVLDVKTLAAAQQLEQAISAELKTVFSGASPALGSVEVTRERTAVRIAGGVSSLLLGLVTAAL